MANKGVALSNLSIKLFVQGALAITILPLLASCASLRNRRASVSMWSWDGKRIQLSPYLLAGSEQSGSLHLALSGGSVIGGSSVAVSELCQESGRLCDWEVREEIDPKGDCQDSNSGVERVLTLRSASRKDLYLQGNGKAEQKLAARPITDRATLNASRWRPFVVCTRSQDEAVVIFQLVHNHNNRSHYLSLNRSVFSGSPSTVTVAPVKGVHKVMKRLELLPTAHVPAACPKGVSGPLTHFRRYSKLALFIVKSVPEF